jgi:hypothetical protein
MNSFEKSETDSNSTAVKYPIDIALDTFRKHRNGYCVILHSYSTPLEPSSIKLSEYFPEMPIMDLINTCKCYLYNNKYDVKIYRYINSETDFNMNKVQDITLRTKMATEHANIIQELLAVN